MTTAKTSTNKLYRNASWLFGGKTAASVFTAIQTVILARALGVSDYGLLALIIAYVDILNQFFDFRVWETATKYIGGYLGRGESNKARSMIKLSYIIDISSGFLALGVAIASAKYISQRFILAPEAYYFIYFYSASLLIDTANQTSYAILRVLDKFKTIAYLSTVHQIIRLLLVCAALWVDGSIKGVLLAYVASSFIGFALRMFVVARALKERGLDSWWSSDLNLIRNQWRGISWFLGNTSLTATLKLAGDNQLGLMALGYFAGRESVAYYKVAKSLVKVMTRIMDPLYEAIYPELVKISARNSLKDFKQLLKDSTVKLMKFSIPAAALIIIFSDLVIGILFGEEYIPASGVMRIVAIAVLITQVSFWINPALLAFGRPGLRTVMLVISSIAYVALLFALAPDYAHVGAAFAFLGYSAVKVLTSFVSLGFTLKREKERIAKVKSEGRAGGDEA
ncbi:MAG: flippase [Deltaproteobacteria bacterium]